MSDDITIKDAVDAILNPKPEGWGDRPQEQENQVWGEFNFKHRNGDFSLKQEVLPEGSAIVEETITEVCVIDLKGKHFKFPGKFRMVKNGDKITFSAIK